MRVADQYHTPIEHGDVFVKEWGSRDIIWMALPKMAGSAKQPWLYVHTMRVDFSWHTTRQSVASRGLRKRKGMFRFVGTAPAWYVGELMEGVKGKTVRSDDLYLTANDLKQLHEGALSIYEMARGLGCAPTAEWDRMHATLTAVIESGKDYNLKPRRRSNG